LSGEATLELRFLGEMEVLRDGQRLDLPPSKKTRALLAYLALTARPHRRDRLCGLLWDVADDPRGALRWSLSRLRAIVDEPGRPRIHTARDSVAFDLGGARADVLALKARCASGLEGASAAELRGLAGEFRGELLEGLDLGDFLDFQAWCVAERESARKLHASVLRALAARLAGDPEAALAPARSLAAVDPLDEAARADLVRLLAATGRRHEALQQYEAASRLLRELGGPETGELEAAWRGTREAVAVPALREAETAPPLVAAGLVGRRAERERLVQAVDEVSHARRERALLLAGEPGLGKSRLLGELSDLVRRRGGTVLEGRAYEAEAQRPFGPWTDALRQLPRAVLGGAPGRDLGALLPELTGEGGPPQSRDRLFGAVVELLAERGVSAPPVLLSFDDVQWLDAASAELVHYVARTSRHRPLLLALSARAGELPDNETVQRTLRSLREMGLLEEIPSVRWARRRRPSCCARPPRESTPPLSSPRAGATRSSPSRWRARSRGARARSPAPWSSSSAAASSGCPRRRATSSAGRPCSAALSAWTG
jgi:DNA-binding SARP family transcriptional activator